MNWRCLFGHASEPLAVVRVVKARTVLFYECQRCGAAWQVLKGQKFKARKLKQASRKPVLAWKANQG